MKPQPGDRFVFRTNMPTWHHLNGATVEVMFDLGTRLAEGDPDRLYQVRAAQDIRLLAFGNELREIA
jgi:hypothetical protein